MIICGSLSSGVFRWPGKKPRAMELRPLGFGEIFDRAMMLYVRNVISFAAIVIVLIVPLAILQYILDLVARPQLDAMIRVLEHPEGARTEHVPPIFDSPAAVAITAVTLLVAYVIWPFALNAVAVGVARLYREKRVEFRACYEAVWHRWLSVVGLLAMELLVLIAWYVVTVLIGVAFALAVALLGAGRLAIATVVPTVATLVVIAMTLLLAPLFVALTFSMYSVVIERRGVLASLALGFSRIFNRSEFWRALLFSISAGAVVLGALALLGALAVVALFAQLIVVDVILESLARAAVAPFGAVLLAVYYFDVRIRQEAFDLEQLLGSEPNAGSASRAFTQDSSEPVYASTAYLSGDERALVKRFLERRDALSAQPRRELAAKLAARVRNRVPADLQRLEDEPLLERL
jgi:hypothetical protein